MVFFGRRFKIEVLQTAQIIVTRGFKSSVFPFAIECNLPIGNSAIYNFL